MTTLLGLPSATPAIPPPVTFHVCPFQAIETAWLTCPTASPRESLHPGSKIAAKPKTVSRVRIVSCLQWRPWRVAAQGWRERGPPLSQEIVAPQQGRQTKNASLAQPDEARSARTAASIALADP